MYYYFYYISCIHQLADTLLNKLFHFARVNGVRIACILKAQNALVNLIDRFYRIFLYWFENRYMRQPLFQDYSFGFWLRTG